MNKKNYHEINQYKDSLFPVEIYHVTNQHIFPAGRGMMDFHWHDELQFTLAIKGDVIIQADAEQYTLKEGEAAFINSGVIHTVTDLSEGGSYTSLNFPYKMLSFFSGSRMEKECVLPYISSNGIPVIVLRPDVTWQRAVLDLLKEINDIWKGFSSHQKEYFVSVKITTLWYTLISHFPNQSYYTSAANLICRQRLQCMLSFIYEHFQEDILLLDIADCAHISIGECCRIFREHLQTTPHQFLTKYRIQKSVELLFGELSISEIAGLCGYNQVSNYISKFKAVMGCTPVQYRKRLRTV